MDPSGAHTLQRFAVVLHHGLKLGFSQDWLSCSCVYLIVKFENISFEVLGAFNGMFAKVG